MTIAEQLRAIADRLEAADAEKAAALDELWHIRTVEPRADYAFPIPGDSAVPVAAGAGVEDGGTSAVPSAPIEQAGPPGGVSAGSGVIPGSPVSPGKGRGGLSAEEDPQGTDADAGSTPARSTTSPFDPLAVAALHACPECGKTTATEVGLTIHRRRLHGVMPSRSAAKSLADRKKVPTNGVGYSQPIGKAAIPPQPVIKHGEEWYLCARCPERFRTAEALKGHMMKGHPPVGPAPTRPFGEQGPVVPDWPGGGLP